MDVNASTGLPSSGCTSPHNLSLSKEPLTSFSTVSNPSNLIHENSSVWVCWSGFDCSAGAIVSAGITFVPTASPITMELFDDSCAYTALSLVQLDWSMSDV